MYWNEIIRVTKLLQSMHRREFLYKIRGMFLAETLGHWCCSVGLSRLCSFATTFHPLTTLRALLRCQTFLCCRVSILWIPQGSVWDRGEYSFLPNFCLYFLRIFSHSNSISLLQRVCICVFRSSFEVQIPTHSTERFRALSQEPAGPTLYRPLVLFSRTHYSAAFAV